MELPKVPDLNNSALLDKAHKQRRRIYKAIEKLPMETREDRDTKIKLIELFRDYNSTVFEINNTHYDYSGELLDYARAVSNYYFSMINKLQAKYKEVFAEFVERIKGQGDKVFKIRRVKKQRRPS